MSRTLTENEVVQHIHDLHENNVSNLTTTSAEECVRRFIRTFADDDMRRDYEAMWVSYPTN
jgi:cyanate lyase